MENVNNRVATISIIQASRQSSNVWWNIMIRPTVAPFIYVCATQTNSMLLFSSKISSSSSCAGAVATAAELLKEGNNHFHWIFGLEKCCFWKVIYHFFCVCLFLPFGVFLTHTFWLLGFIERRLNCSCRGEKKNQHQPIILICTIAFFFIFFF